MWAGAAGSIGRQYMSICVRTCKRDLVFQSVHYVDTSDPVTVDVAGNIIGKEWECAWNRKLILPGIHSSNQPW